MNIMRKLWVAGNGPSGSGSPPSSQSLSLGLMHLRKLFGDYLHSPSDDKIYNMLPLFCKVFGASSAADMIERFPEVNSFCQVVSKLMVSEIRKRASNQCTETASVSIIQFFEAASESEEDSKGWNLLTTLNLLSAGEQTLVDVMSGVAVPSTLVKCLYLFFDLPPVHAPENKGPGSDFSPMERRLLVQKVFVQLLIRLSTHATAAEELAKKDDLTLLFSAVTSWCAPHNAIWRKTATEALMTISTNGLTPPVLSHIHSKGCIALCLDNLRRASHLTPTEITEMVLTVFCFLKDSAELSPVLLDDFKSAQGYQYLTETLIRLETDLSSEGQEAIKNLVLVVGSLTLCGTSVLKPNMANVESLFSLPSFQLPPPGARGTTVRNLQSFQVLHTVFTKSNTAYLSGVVLDAILSIFKADHCNYFIIDPVLPQMASVLIHKSADVQLKFLEIVEFIVFQLQFTPCKELIAISRILKNDLLEPNTTAADSNKTSAGSNRNSITSAPTVPTPSDIAGEIQLKLICVKMLLNLAKHNVLFKDVFREIGVLEVIITSLHRFTSDLRNQPKEDGNQHSRNELGIAVIELLTIVLNGSVQNVNLFRENEGIKCVLQLITDTPNHRGSALNLMQQLLMSQGGEEEMASVLVALHAADQNTGIPVKIEILGCLMSCFRESHRARCNFRKAGGFLYLMSVLVSLEGLFFRQEVSASMFRDRLLLLQLIFNTFALVMRFEPANAKLFHQEICLPSLADTLRLLGCFLRDCSNITPSFSRMSELQNIITEENIQLLHSIFSAPSNSLDPYSYHGKVPFSIIISIFVFRLLYDLAIDACERTNITTTIPSSNAIQTYTRKQLSTDDVGSGTVSGNISETSSPLSTPNLAMKKAAVGSLNLTPPSPELVVVHPAVVIVMIRLLPSIKVDKDDDNLTGKDTRESMFSSCQLYCAELIKSLVRSERNQQLMGQCGLTEEILERYSVALHDESHYLHSPVHYIFERVAAHYLVPKDLRVFLRLGNPLNCEKIAPPSANISSCYSPVPLARVKSLVSTTTPKSFSHSASIHQSQTFSTGARPTPAFVEFDMSAEGFGCLFLPSLAPHNFQSGSEIGNGSILGSGIGMGERVFPGATCMSFSTWFCVDKFSDPRNDPHPIRILTIIKEGGGNQRLCLSIVISARDKALLVSTRESQLPPQGVGEWEPDVSPNATVRVWCPELLHEGQWNHLLFTFSTSSTHSFTLFVNGKSTNVGRLEYPHRTKGASFSAFIGTPPMWRKASRLTWRQGVGHLLEDWVPSSQTVAAMYKLGPEYPGSWQSVKIQSDATGVLIAEDKLIFGFNALAVSQLTLAKIRKIYSKADAKAIAKQLGLSSHENATPISILHNSAAHLIGPARTLGGVTIGYLGVRIFTPLPVSRSLISVGGIQVLIGLVAMATSSESLYASLKAVSCVIRNTCTSGTSSAVLVDRSSWQMLGYLLKRKKNLLSMRVLHLVIGLVSAENNSFSSQCGQSSESHVGFVELLGDLDIWCPSYVITTKGKLGSHDSNASTPSEGPRKQVSSEECTPSGMLPIGTQKFDFVQANIDLEKALYEHFLQILNEDPKNSLELLREANIVPKLLRRLSQSSTNTGPLFLLLSHLLAHKGNATASDLITFGHYIVGTLPTSDSRETNVTDVIELRNKGLQLIHSLMYTGKVLNVGFCEELVHRLGFDFVLNFTAPHLHPSTVLWSLRILLLLITSSATLKAKFREANYAVFSFGRTVQAAVAAHQSGGGTRNPSAFPALKKQETREEDVGVGNPVNVGPVNVTAIGFVGVKSNKGIISGWARLTWLLIQRCEDISVHGPEIFPCEIWLIISAMVLNQPCRNVSLKSTDPDQITLDAIWNYVFAVPSAKMTSSLYGKVVLCPDAIITLMTIVRCYVIAESAMKKSQDSNSQKASAQLSPTLPTSPSTPSDVGSCMLQLMSFLYTNTPEFQSLFSSPEILNAIAAVYIPIDVRAGVTVMENLIDCTETEIVKVSAADQAEQKDTLEVGSEADSINTGTGSSSSAELTPHSPKVAGWEVVPDLSSLAMHNNLDAFINHPAKKFALNFLRHIILDSIFHAQSQAKTVTAMNTVIDTILEAGSSDFLLDGNTTASGPQCPADVLLKFHTNLLGSLLDHLIACDLDRMTNHLHAVAQLLSRIVDKLWLESFARDPHVVLDFLLILVNHCRSKRVPPTTTDSIYNSLNRVVLFVLSRPSNRWAKVEALKKIRGVRTVIFGSGNHQQDFFGCLVHVLMQLVEGLPISLESGTKTQWHVRMSQMSENDESLTNDAEKQKEAREAAKLESEISTMADKVWEDLFISKKPMVEEVFKITFHSPQPPALSSLREKVGSAANKLWLNYVASETSAAAKKSANQAGMSQSWEIHQQLQSKFQKVTGGLTRLAGRSGMRKDSEKERPIKDLISQCRDAKKCQAASMKNIILVKEVLEAQEKFDRENLKHLTRYVRDTLLPQLELELTRERGIWGPRQPSRLDKWMLDTTEGPCRMRKKLIKNDMFYIHYPYAEPVRINSGSTGSAVSSPKARRVNPPMSRDSQEFHKKFKHQHSLLAELVFGQAGGSVSSIEDTDDNGLMGTNSSTSDPALSPRTTSQSQAEDPFPEECTETSDPDNQSLLFRLIGSQNEKISQIFRMAQIQGLDTAEGLLLFGKEHFYLVSGFTILTKTREIKDMYYLPANMYEPILPPQCYGSGPSPAKPRSKTHTCWKFSYDDLREVHKRRYLLQPIALEIFCSDGRNYLLAYPRKVRNVVFQKFMSVSKRLSDSGTDAKQSVAGQRRSTSIEQSSGLFSSLMGDTTVTQRWVKGEISNFQYLMHLNTLAGRSYNDLMQYPVFPWILADYDSPFLDLSDSDTFRDLSKPMGAQSSGRLVQFIKRYREWDDPHNETPPYHYGTHYSSAMIVCSYLVRMEPFAQHFLRLQGGHFDLADRMFHSIKEAWTSASKHNMADVKELIPEFFYLPEFLKNSNSFDLGCKQNGVTLGDVVLPPWAKDDPREFIRMHREALESDYVSQHLNEWIDLIFGCKQQGPLAVEAVNVFHHLFYEGNVDIYNIDDPLKKNATIGFINNFGQIPKQLFKKLHPVKKITGGGQGMSINLNILDTVNPLLALAAQVTSNQSEENVEKVFFHHLENLRPTLVPIRELKGPIGQIVPLEKTNSIISVEQNKFLLSPSRYISWGFADCSVRVCSVETDRPIFIWEYSQQQLWTGYIGEIVSCCGSEKIAVTGSTNTVVSVWDIGERDLRLKAHLYGHTEPITCLACSPSYNIIVSGSKDTTCILWDLARLTFVRQLVPHYASVDAVGINELTGDIATCDGSWLRLWSVNGEPLCQVDTAGVGGGGGMSQGVLCVSFSYLNEWDPDNVIMTGSTDGIVRMWSLRYFQVPRGLAGRGFTKSNDDDSSVTTASDSDEEVVVNDEEMDAGVFDPDKDHDSQEEDQQEGMSKHSSHSADGSEPIKSVIRRQRALSSGTSTSQSRQDSDADKVFKKPEFQVDEYTSDPVPADSKTTTAEDSHSLVVGSKIRASKSETSLLCDSEEAFEIVSDADVLALRKEEKERKASRGSALAAAHQLKEGHVWQKKLTFRGKLTMHTAYDRKDNTEPASITAIAVSKDHKNVYVGDARGRVFSWTVCESASGRADHWVKDEGSDACAACQTKFTFSNSRHHCRNCGGIFCSKCSRFESEIFRLRILRPVRVCQNCFLNLKGKGRLTSMSSDA